MMQKTLIFACALVAGCSGSTSAPVETTPGDVVVVGRDAAVDFYLDGFKFSLALKEGAWRLFEGYHAENSGGRFSPVGAPIINNGEWSCAIREVGAADFICGFHRFERLDSVLFSLDGKPGEILGTHTAKELTATQESTLFSYGTETPIAERAVTYRAAVDGITVEQRIHWLQPVLLENAYLAMLPIKRHVGGEQITDTAKRAPHYASEDVSEAGFEPIRTPTNVIELSGPQVVARVSLLEAPALPNAFAFVSNAELYNKVYFDVSGEHLTAPGEVWTVVAHYEIRQP